MYELNVEETFAAAHALRGYEGPCENVHGHTFKVQIQIKGEKLNKLGLLEDFKTIKSHLHQVIKKFDHADLNNLPEFKEQNPSSENIARVIFEQLKPTLPSLAHVTIWESATTSASYSQ
ncbi:6-carboxytetrahydropterin synthase QueD [Candidatus Saganbacteria bacterium]|nr:6-carboxytetrahydropterin synthase QueD [Candidatus Saganbacteria bacterium]